MAIDVECKTYTVSPWGEVAADTGTTTRLRLAGQQYDQATRLYYMRARYYDPALGRFLSEDPIGITGGLNLYAYAGNDPVNHADPSGKDYRWTDQGYCQRMADIAGTYDLETGAVTSWHIVDEYEDCKDGTSPSGNGGGGGGTSGGETKRSECRKAIITGALDFVMDLTFLHMARNFEHAGEALADAALGDSYHLLSAKPPYFGTVRAPTALPGALGLLGANATAAGQTVHQVEHAVIGAQAATAGFGGGLLNWETLSGVAKFAAGFAPGPVGAIVDGTINAITIAVRCL